MPFLYKLESRFNKTKSLLCLGLDPCVEDVDEFCKIQNCISDDQISNLINYCKYMVEETLDYILCVKPNLAFFIQYGYEGIRALKEVIDWIPDDLPVILDCKFGDISNTMQRYTSFAFNYLHVDAITVNLYMGLDVISPLIKPNNVINSVFVLASTSNQSADVIQSSIIGDDKLFIHMIKNSDKFSLEHIGFIIGATKIDSMIEARKITQSWFLVPGIGAQNGDLSQVIKYGLRDDGKGVIISVSRGISKSGNPKQASKKLFDEIKHFTTQYHAVH